MAMLLQLGDHETRGGAVRIRKNCVVCMDYTIRLANGQVVESSVGQEPLIYLHGRRQIVPGVEKAIEGLEPGALLEVVVPPSDAYGDRDPTGVFVVPRASFPVGEEIGPGMMFSASRSDGKSITFRVIEANDELVLVDTNHPLAGETLHISIQVHYVRNASVDELHAGRVDGDRVEQHYLA
jgi:FKBP-type peptidyl-prolyl cis-trans isomerase SlyD